MAKIQVNRLTNANVYINGNNLLGRVEEIKLPDITAIMAEHKALGMVGKMELPSGFDKLEGSIKWNSFYADVFAQCANPFTSVELQCRGNVETYTSQGRTDQQSAVTYITCTFKKFPAGSFKQHDNAEFEMAFAATAIKITSGGRDLLELDVLANIYAVDGVDQLSAYRANIGA